MKTFTSPYESKNCVNKIIGSRILTSFRIYYELIGNIKTFGCSNIIQHINTTNVTICPTITIKYKETITSLENHLQIFKSYKKLFIAQSGEKNILNVH